MVLPHGTPSRGHDAAGLFFFLCWSFQVSLLEGSSARQHEFIRNVHTRSVRDIRCREADALVASVALDKMLKICDLRTNSCVLDFECGAPLWSTSWRGDDDHTLYCGSAQGVVLVFDMRNTQSHVARLDQLGSSSPVHSLSYVPATKQLLIGNLEGIMAHGLEPDDRPQSLPVHGLSFFLFFFSFLLLLWSTDWPGFQQGWRKR